MDRDCDGAALGLTGLGLAAWAMTARSALDQKLAVDPQTGLVETISYPDAKAESDAIDRKRLVAGVVGGLGLAATGAGAWLLWRAYRDEAPPAVTVLPTGPGWVATLQF